MSRRILLPIGLASALVTFAGLALGEPPGMRAHIPMAEASPATLALAQGSLARRAPDRPLPLGSARAPGQPSPQSSPVQGGIFYPDRATPFFQHLTSAPLAERLKMGDERGALAAADAALAQQAPHPERLLFVMAYLMHRQDRHAEAAPLFEGLTGSLGPLGGLAAYFAARSYYHLGLHERALSLASRISLSDSARPRAILLTGDLHRARARWAEAAQAYETFLKDHGGRSGTQEARLRLAECLSAMRPKEPAVARRVVELLRRVSLESPGSPWGRRAEALLPGALASLGDPRQRAILSRSSCADELRRTEALLKMGRLGQAAASLQTAGKLGGCPKLDLCQAATALGRRQSRKKAARQKALATLAIARRHCVGPANSDLWMKATYSLARTHAALGRVREAAALFRQMEARHPGHSYADDARYQLAGLMAKQGKEREAERLLRSLPVRYPKGDMSHAALWRLAFAAVQRGAFKEALGLLAQAEALPGEPDREEDAGRASYWRGQVLARLGRPDEAVKAWVELAEKRLMSFYSLLALNRLSERAPETARTILVAWRRSQAPPSWQFGPAPVFSKPGFVRAVELARMGLGELAAEELGNLGISSPVRSVGEVSPQGGALPLETKGSAMGKEAAEALWAAAVLYDRAGLQQRSHWIVRHALRDHEVRPPVGVDRAKWRVGFPEAYASLVKQHASANRLPSALVFGLMREESAFNPGLVSHAGAVGLMQLLEETARRFRAGPRGPINRAALKDPHRNVPIGAKYLGWLLRLFHGQLVLAVAAYNAGETKVFSWMQERGHLPVDRFVEEIPFRETRHYVKRVLGSAFAYAVLEGSTEPLFTAPEVFPPDLVVKSRAWKQRTREWARASRDGKTRRGAKPARQGRPADRRRGAGPASPGSSPSRVAPRPAKQPGQP